MSALCSGLTSFLRQNINHYSRPLREKTERTEFVGQRLSIIEHIFAFR